MTRNQPRNSKTPSSTRRSAVTPTLGIALNWVPPKTPAPTRVREKKRSPAPQG